MSYAVKEVFYTLQGEGANTGRPADCISRSTTPALREASMTWTVMCR